MANFPALPLWCDAFAMDCGHLSLAEEGLYFRLLRTMWTSPECRVPNDNKWLMRRLRVTAEEFETIVRPIIGEFCQSSGNWITQKRLLKERDHVSGNSRKQSEKANKRWSSAHAAAMPDDAGAMPGSIYDGGKFKSGGGTVSANPLENNNSDVCRGNAPTPTPTPTKKEERDTSYLSPAQPKTASLTDTPAAPSFFDQQGKAAKQGKKESKQESAPQCSARPPRKNASVVPESFHPFWAVYPRHASKGAAEKAYIAALKLASAADILAGAQRYATERANEDPKYTKYPATWLNQRCWTDEAPAARITIDQFGNPDMPPPRANGHAPRRSRTDEAVDRMFEKFMNGRAS